VGVLIEGVIHNLKEEKTDFNDVSWKEFFPTFTPEDLVNLSKFDIYIKLMIDGVTSEAFSAHTLAPLVVAQENADIKEKIIKVTRERYAKPREEIEDKIIRWSENKGDENSERPLEATTRDKKERPARTPVSTNSSDKPKISKNVTCTFCGKKTTINFEPDPSKPIYCRECLNLSRAGKIPPPSSIKIVSEDNPKEEFASLADILKSPPKIKIIHDEDNKKVEDKSNHQDFTNKTNTNSKTLEPGEIIKF